MSKTEEGNAQLILSASSTVTRENGKCLIDVYNVGPKRRAACRALSIVADEVHEVSSCPKVLNFWVMFPHPNLARQCQAHLRGSHSVTGQKVQCIKPQISRVLATKWGPLTAQQETLSSVPAALQQGVPPSSGRRQPGYASGNWNNDRGHAKTGSL
jgi:hypothetical protein